MPDKDEKIDKIFEAVFEMRPMLSDVRENQRAIDERMRAAETRGAEHGVKIDRIQSDIDGLGRKVRAVEVRSTVPSAVAAADTPGKWAALADFLGALPAYWHVVASTAMFLAAIATTLARKKP